MTVGLEDIAVEADGHVVHFYEDDLELATAVGGYLAAASRAGAVAVVIATESHVLDFETELVTRGVDPAACSDDGTLICLDASATMAGFIRDGKIDGAAFDRVVGTVVRRAAATGRAVRAYGEMVSLLWDAGDVLGAIELEKLWNDLGRELQFSLLCSYRSESVSRPGQLEALREVCRLHSAAWRVPPSDELEQHARGSAAAEVSLELGADPGAPAAARRFVAGVLRRWGYEPALCDDAVLITSELATNAVMHARSSFTVIVRHTPSGVQLRVRDARLEPPRLLDQGLMAVSGRGLRLVGLLADDWGTELCGNGKTVWADIQRPAMN
jgi:anti-sigma regulatory factor (Ser/Thr protein kinase)